MNDFLFLSPLHCRGGNWKRKEAEKYRVIEKLVLPIHEFDDLYRSIYYKSNDVNLLETDFSFGEIEVMMEEWCGTNNAQNDCESLRRRISVRSVSGLQLHQSFALPPAENDFEKHGIRHPKMCLAYFWGENRFWTKKFLCVLALPSQLRLFDLRPTNMFLKDIDMKTDTYSNSNAESMETEVEEGQYISLPFEACSIFPFEHQNNGFSGGLIMQRLASQDDYNTSDLPQYDCMNEKYRNDMGCTNLYEHPSTKGIEGDMSIKVEGNKIIQLDLEDHDDACTINDPPHPVRLGSVLGADVTMRDQKKFNDGLIDEQIDGSGSSMMPSLFYLRHPLDEVRPMSLLLPHKPYHSIYSSIQPSIDLFTDVHENVLFFGMLKLQSDQANPCLCSVCVTYNSNIERHAIWILKEAPKPPPLDPLWKQRATHNEKGHTTAKSNMNDLKFHSTNTILLSPESSSFPQELMFNASIRKSTSSNTATSMIQQNQRPSKILETMHRNNVNNPPLPPSSTSFSDIHPEFGLSMLWMELPELSCVFEDEEKNNFEKNKKLRSTGRALDVFLASDENKCLTNICLLCPRQKHGSHPSDKNTRILRCLSIRHCLKDEKKRKILGVAHVIDLPCISAQAISTSDAVDVMVCAFPRFGDKNPSGDVTKNINKKSEEDPKSVFKLFRGDFNVCDCALPFATSLRNDGPLSLKKRYSKSLKKKEASSWSVFHGMESTYLTNEWGHVLDISHRLRNRIDVSLCKKRPNSFHFNDQVKSDNDDCDFHSFRFSFSLAFASSPLSEAVLEVIDAAPDIPNEFTLKLRAECMRLMQSLPNIESTSQNNYISSCVDHAWTAVTNVILFLFHSYLDKTFNEKLIVEDSKISNDSNTNLTDFDFLHKSQYHEGYSKENASIFAFEKYANNFANVKEFETKKDESSLKNMTTWQVHLLDTFSNFFTHDESFKYNICCAMFDALHLLYEDSKLHQMSRGMSWLAPLGSFLMQIGIWCNDTMNDYLEYYRRDLGLKPELYIGGHFINAPLDSLSNRAYNRRLSKFKSPPSILGWVDFVIRGYEVDESDEGTAYFFIEPNKLNPYCVSTKKIHRLYSIFRELHSYRRNSIGLIHDSSKIRRFDYSIVLAMVEENMTDYRNLVNELPAGLVVPICETLRRCRNDPPEHWPPGAYALIGRSDLHEMEAIRRGDRSPPLSSTLMARLKASSREAGRFAKAPGGISENDGVGDIEGFSSMLFPKDRRMLEVARLLCSSRPIVFRVERPPEVSDHDYENLKQAKLLLMCSRTLALPVGRGMLTIGTMKTIFSEPLSIPILCLTGKVPPSNATVALDSNSTNQSKSVWPEFHNGVAAGLQVGPRKYDCTNESGGIERITRTWIIFNRSNRSIISQDNQYRNNAASSNANSNSSSESVDYSHGGLLLALGLQGYLSSLAITDIYEYLTMGTLTTTVGILLGMAATKRSTCDPSVSKMLCLHVPSLLPPSFAEMDVASAAQAAAIAGIGLLYQGSSHRLMTEFLLNEMGKFPTDHSTSDRESYTLTCGLALGMINLSNGETKTKKNAGLTDLRIEERLNRYIVGGDDVPARQKNESFNANNGIGDNEKCSRILERDSINTNVTAPGAILALGLIYFGTRNQPIASILNLPQTYWELDNVRPDLLMLRVISRSMIMWCDVEPSSLWIEAQIPSIVKKSYDFMITSVLRKSDAASANKTEKSSSKKTIQSGSHKSEYSVDRQAIRQAYIFIVSGALFGMGLRFAGTGNGDAAKAIIEKINEFRKLREDNDPLSVALRPGRPILEMCIGCAAISLGLVMSGTGDTDSLRVLRELRWVCDPEVTYGNHMAFGAAIGLVFLGGGSCTLGREPEDIAALLLAFFPRFPADASDNQYHLQALRHCYVLAVKNHELEAIDVDTRDPVYIPLEIHFKDEQLEPVKLTAPCLLCNQSLISHIRVDSTRYHRLVIDIASLQKKNSLSPILVKRKTGVLNYAQDPYAVRSLLIQSGGSKSGSALTLIESFTADKTLLAFAQYLCDCKSDAFICGKPDVGMGLTLEKFCTSTLHECLTEEKPETLPIFLSLYCLAMSLEIETNSGINIWDLRLIKSYYEGFDFMWERYPDFNRLLKKDFIASLFEIVETLFVKNKLNEHALQKYEDNSLNKCSVYEGSLFGSFLIWYDIPNISG